MTFRSLRARPGSSVRSLVAASLLAVMSLAGATARAADLDLEVSGFSGAPGQQGLLMVAVFNGGPDWLKKPAAVARAAVAEARDGRLTVRLSGLPDGPIAVSVFQDLNGNGRLDTNPMGMPVEPFAFSRQAQGHYGPPAFEQAALPAGTTQHAIRLSPLQ